MTIEVVSHPKDLATWEATRREHPFYLELFGETNPVLDTAYAELVPAGPVDGKPETARAAPVYEYWWTIGHAGEPHDNHGLLDWFGWDREKVNGGGPNWNDLDDDVAARIYVYFPLGGGWRIKELAASVRYLTPIREQASFWEKAAEEWKTIQPVVEDASKIAAIGAPAGGAVAADTARVLSALAQIKLTSVPQADGFNWSVAKVTFGTDRGMMQGVMWRLPKKMFTVLGGRLTGSVAVSFIPARTQVEHEVTEAQPEPKNQALLAHAAIYPKGQDPVWIPDPTPREFVRLEIKPKLPD